ncbi:MAG: GNAT family N-acetyltransferase [Desulfosarcinaceae bacterium]
MDSALLESKPPTGTELMTAPCSAGAPKSGKQFTKPPGDTYPDRYRQTVHIPEVGPVCIRPIRPDDAPHLSTLFKRLSPRSIYFRYFTYIKQLSPEMLNRFTQIDYEIEIALVAMRSQSQVEEMLGVSRIVRLIEAERAEFSVLVGDSWQGRGIGACLMRHAIDIARQRGIRQIFGIVMAENTHMIALGRKLHCKLERLPSSFDLFLTLNLDEEGPSKSV